MKFIKRGFAQKLIIVLVALMVFNIAVPKQVKAWDIGGVLLKPISSLILVWMASIDVQLGTFLYGIGQATDDISDIVEDITDGDDPGGVSVGTYEVVERDPLTLEIDANNKTFTAEDILIGPDAIFQGKIGLLDANFFQADDVGKALNGFSLTYTIKLAIAEIYVVLRNLCAVIMLGGLIFVGIRILLTSNHPEKQAQWKSILTDWLIGLVLLIFVHILMIGIFYISDTITFVLAKTLVGSGSMNSELISKCADSWDSAEQIICLFMLGYLIYLTVIYAIAYFKRLFWVALLIVFAPVMALMYSFGRATKQIFGQWLKEYMMIVLIQPYHMLVYTVLVSLPLAMVGSTTGAGPTGVTSWLGNTFTLIYALGAMSFIKPAEKYMRGLFGMDKSAAASHASYESGKKTLDTGIKTVATIAAAVGTAGAASAAMGAGGMLSSGAGGMLSDGAAKLMAKETAGTIGSDAAASMGGEEGLSSIFQNLGAEGSTNFAEALTGKNGGQLMQAFSGENGAQLQQTFSGENGGQLLSMITGENGGQVLDILNGENGGAFLSAIAEGNGDVDLEKFSTSKTEKTSEKKESSSGAGDESIEAITDGKTDLKDIEVLGEMVETLNPEDQSSGDRLQNLRNLKQEYLDTAEQYEKEGKHKEAEEYRAQADAVQEDIDEIEKNGGEGTGTSSKDEVRDVSETDDGADAAKDAGAALVLEMNDKDKGGIGTIKANNVIINADNITQGKGEGAGKGLGLGKGEGAGAGKEEKGEGTQGADGKKANLTDSIRAIAHEDRLRQLGIKRGESDGEGDNDGQVDIANEGKEKRKIRFPGAMSRNFLGVMTGQKSAMDTIENSAFNRKLSSKSKEWATTEGDSKKAKFKRFIGEKTGKVGQKLGKAGDFIKALEATGGLDEIHGALNEFRDSFFDTNTSGDWKPTNERMKERAKDRQEQTKYEMVNRQEKEWLINDFEIKLRAEHPDRNKYPDKLIRSMAEDKAKEKAKSLADTYVPLGVTSLSMAYKCDQDRKEYGLTAKEAAIQRMQYEGFIHDSKNIAFVNENYPKEDGSKNDYTNLEEAYGPNTRDYFQSGYQQIDNMDLLYRLTNTLNVSAEKGMQLDQILRRKGGEIDYSKIETKISKEQKEELRKVLDEYKK